MKVLLINGSPKGKESNTYKLATSFIDGIKSQNTTEFVLEELDINKLDIKPCLGCFSCWSKTPGKCVINDDMNNILEKMLESDFIIWSFPLYFFNVPGKLKTLIDRQLPFALPFMEKDSESGSHPARYDLSKKKYVLISTCGFYTPTGNYDSVVSMFDHFLGKNNYETIFCSQGELFRVPELSSRTNEYLKFVKQAGSEYALGTISDKTRENLKTFLFPREIYEAMADASWGIEKVDNENNEIKKLDDSLIFTKQMAALYNKNSYTGKDIVLEMNYTDIGKTYQIILKKDGHEVITENFKKYTTKIETPFSVWNDIACDKISGQEALMKKMYKVKGDFNLMIHWDDYFGSPAETSSNSGNSSSQKENSKTNMMILLLPWIIFWATISANPINAGFISIICCSLIHLLFFKNKKTIYDILSNTIIILLSVMIVFNNNTSNIALILSYLGFGLMWSLSCLTKIPLSAYYSANDYNGEKEFSNPLFIKTNRILTFMWGILYIFTAAITYFSIGTSLASYLGLINNILPLFMGIFTLWFQKWYPAKVARG